MIKNTQIVKKIFFNSLGDERGDLFAIESGKEAPFEIKRVYYITNTKKNDQRGFHAHRNLKQVIICVKGSCKFIVDDGAQKEEINLNRPDEGLLIGNFIWREMHDFSEDCVLLVLASEHYDPSDYIHDYRQFQIEKETVKILNN